MNDVDGILKKYEPGKPENKPDVLQQIGELKEKREKMIQSQLIGQLQMYEKKINEQNNMMQQVILENNTLKEKVKYLEDKMTKLIQERIQEKKSLQETIKQENILI
jgi:predicted nuclease with TOPRIM domain